MKLIILYAHFEGPETYKDHKDFRDNLLFFLKYGYFNDSEIDYIFVINGTSTIKFPSNSNIKVIYRENTGYDFAGHREGLKLVLKPYDYYIFLNSTVRGPFMPLYTYNRLNWWDPFIQILQSDSSIKMVGSTINIEPPSDFVDRMSPHVQSYVFVVDPECFQFLKQSGVFEKTYNNVKDVIVNQEIGISRRILEHGWNISCLVPEYQNKDYRMSSLEGKIKGNILAHHNPLGRIIHPYEVIFMKTNRNIGHQELTTLTKYYMNTQTIAPSLIKSYNLINHQPKQTHLDPPFQPQLINKVQPIILSKSNPNSKPILHTTSNLKPNPNPTLNLKPNSNPSLNPTLNLKPTLTPLFRPVKFHINPNLNIKPPILNLTNLIKPPIESQTWSGGIKPPIFNIIQ